MAETLETSILNIDEALNDLSVLSRYSEVAGQVDALLDGDYQAILAGEYSQKLFAEFLSGEAALSKTLWADNNHGIVEAIQTLLTGLTAFNAFLQANVTGPPLARRSLLFEFDATTEYINSCREKCTTNLSIDGLSVYQYIPHVELFSLARAIFNNYFPRTVNGRTVDSRWMRIRINAYHQRLLSSGTSNARLNDSSMKLQSQIEADIKSLEHEILALGSAYSTEAKVQFLLEKAQIYIMQGLDVKAKQNVHSASTLSEFTYALSGALGKRTRFQEKDTSQLVVFAKSKPVQDEKKDLGTGGLSSTTEIPIRTAPSATGPTSLVLEDDTLLESIKFSEPADGLIENSTLPPQLKDLSPEKQPQLTPLDQIILLTEATLKDVFSPMDKLNSEEILPYAVRVLSDNPSNWQIYTQALLVRSRIEAHRSRTRERSVLQLQAIVDQIIADTQDDKIVDGGDGIPQIQVTSFLPKPTQEESAPVTERLKFVHQLNTPTRWEVETELAYAWSSAGSFVSALEIFKRLRLWAEVALCYHSIGQEDKARQIVRRQLYYSSKGPQMDRYEVDATEVIEENWDGEVRMPSPPHAPRLWCILGDLDQDPSCWLRAWDISKHRYARAQRTLGEYYSRQGDWSNAREAYIKATAVNRQNSDAWSRLGDIDLRVGNWDGAIIAFQQSIMIEDDDAKTFSNLGSALLSKHAEMIKLAKVQNATPAEVEGNHTEDEDVESPPVVAPVKPEELLKQALIAYKRGASIAYDNWQIWDNVITLASRMNPPSYPDVLMGLRAVIRIQGPKLGEKTIDTDILRALVGEVTSRERPKNASTTPNTYLPARGSLARAVIEMVDNDIEPLITARGELWAIVEKLRLYCQDYAGALSCAEKRWRISTAGEEWIEDAEKWKVAVDATDGLVSAFENYGPQERSDGSGEVEKGWRMKARSAVRGILGKARGIWEDTDEFQLLTDRLEELRSA